MEVKRRKKPVRDCAVRRESSKRQMGGKQKGTSLARGSTREKPWDRRSKRKKNEGKEI